MRAKCSPTLKLASSVMGLMIAMAISFPAVPRALPHQKPTPVTKRPKANLPGPSGSIQALVFSPDGKVLASGSSDRTVKLWDAQTGELLRTITNMAMSPVAFYLAFSPDSKTLAVTVSEKDVLKIKVHLYDVTSGKLMRALEGAFLAGNAAFSGDGKLLATASERNRGPGLLGPWEVKLWDAQSGKLSQTLPGSNADPSIKTAFSPDGKILAIAAEKSLKLWDAPTGKLMRSLNTIKNTPADLAFSPDGETLGFAEGEMDDERKTLSFWNVRTATLPRIIDLSELKDSGVYAIAFAPDGQTLAVGTETSDYSVKLWNVQTGELKKTLAGQGSKVLTLAFTPDGKALLSGSVDGAVRRWDTETGESKRVLMIAR